MKKNLSLLLAVAVLLSALNITLFISAETDKAVMSVGNSDAILIGESPVFVQGGADNANLCVVENGSFSSSFAVTNSAVTASKVFTTWRWFRATSGFYANAQPGSYVYAPDIKQKSDTPEIVYAVPKDTVLQFKLGLRLDAADWSDFKIEFSDDGETYTDVKEADISYITSSYEASDCSYSNGDKKGQKHTVFVRSYDLSVAADGYIKISLPKAETVQNNIVANYLNSDGNSLAASSAFLIPASLVSADSDRLEVGDADSITVDTSGKKLATDAGKVAYDKTAVTSLAILNDAVCTVKVDTNWRWLNASSDFYTDVAAKDEWLYSVNPYYATTNGQIIYKVTGSTKVSFNIIIRDKTADWTDVSLTYSTDGSQFEAISSNNVNYSEMEYTANISTMRVRSYQIYIPSNDGYLAINLPNAESVMTGTIENNLNSARESIVYSSVMVTPAICGETSFVLEPGKKDSIILSDDATYIKGSANDTSIAVIGSSDIEAQYAKLNGIVATKVFSTWRWFKSSSSFYTDVIPASTADKSSWLYAVDLAFTGASPNIEYKVTENSVVKFKIGLRTDTANWSDLTIKFSDDGSTYNALGDAVKFTEESYVAEDCRYYGGDKSGAFHEVIVREYTVDIAKSGMLCISFPQGNSIKENITANYLNTSGDSLVYSSVFMTPAECIKVESIKGVFAKDGQEIVSISSDAISITADITYEELSKHIILKNVVTEYYDKSGNEIADMKTVATSGAKVKVLNSDGTIFKEYKIKRIYIEKRTLKIGQQDTVNWENTPHYYNDSGTLVSTSEYLDADTLEYAKISGSILIKNTNSWVFSPFFTVSLWEKPHPIVYAMGYRAHGKEPPSIAWHVQSRSEIQIPISLPTKCEEFFLDFKFMYSSDGTNWENVPSHLIDYKSVTRSYNTWDEATLRTYSVQVINSGWVRVVYPEWDKMSEEIKKINAGISFIESAACIVPPRVVQSSKDSSVSAGDGEIVVNVDNDKKHISLMCLIEDNLTVGDLISALSLKHCYCKAFDSNGNSLSSSSPVLENMRLSFYARGNIFEADDTHLFDYTVSVTKVKEFYKPKLTSKDASVVVDDANCSISVSYKVTDSINYEQLLSLIEFSHCTYKLVTVGDTEYTNTSNSVGADPVYINIYTKDCPGIEDGTLYDTYEVFGEILKTDRIFVSRDTSKIYIDEAAKLIYFDNGMTISEFCDGVITINTTLDFYKVVDGLEEQVTDYSLVLDESYLLSSTVGSTVLYYELKPMTTVITPASTKNIKTRHAKIIPGYDSDMKYIIPVAIGIGVCLIGVSVLVILIVRKKKRKGGEK